MVSTFSVLSFGLVMALSISFIETVSSTNGGSFRIELVHRDSPRSPFYNHSETIAQRFDKSMLRSMSRLNRISTTLSAFNVDCLTTIESKVIPDEGDYLMKLSIGTPPVQVLAIADTGSDLIWTQCQPCKNCYKQDLPLFDPRSSSTYREIPCDSSPCRSLSTATCVKNACGYAYSYGDRSQTNGILATETFTFDSIDQNQRNILIPMLVYGCGHENGGSFTSHGSGLVGLGGGPLSLVSQLGSKIDGKFSYCLVDMFEESASSKLNFGTQAVISGADKVMSTPLVSKEPATFYYLTLEAVSVGSKRLENKPMNQNQFGADIVEGNIVIDSGTTLTMLPVELYNHVETTVRDAIPVDTVQDSSGNLQLCYSTRAKFEVPNVIFHFTGADVSLPRSNTFSKVSEDLVCLTMVPSEDISIFGNLAQINFVVEYDLVGKKVSFAQADCTKY